MRHIYHTNLYTCKYILQENEFRFFVVQATGLKPFLVSGVISSVKYKRECFN